MEENSSLIEPIELIEIEQYSNQVKSGKPKDVNFIKISSNEIILDGYGRCRSCDCRGYISKHNGTHECKNCNHHFDRHWD